MRGIKLNRKPDQGLVNELMTNLYMHAQTKKDLMNEVEMRQDYENSLKIKRSQQEFVMGNQGNSAEISN